MRLPSVLLAFTSIIVSSAHAIGEDAPLPANQPPHQIGVAAPDPAMVKLQGVLKQRLAERDALQREIEELRRASQTSEQFLVKIKLIELNRSKLVRAGFDFGEVTSSGPVSSSVADLISKPGEFGITTIEETQGFLAFMNALRADGIATILAEPTLVTIYGRPASFHQGGIVWLPSPGEVGRGEPEKFGTEVKVLVESAGNNQAKLQLKLRQSTLGVPETAQESWIPSTAPQIVSWAIRQIPFSAAPLPTSHVTEISTGIEATLGQPVLLGGLRTVKTREVQLDGGVESRKEDFEMLVFISVESAEAMDPNAPAIQDGIQPTTYTTSPSAGY